MARTRRSVKKVEFSFDKSKAEEALEKFRQTTAALARHEGDRGNKWRGMAKAAREFLVTLFPIGEELDKLKRRIGSEQDITVNLPSEITKFLQDKELAVPYWTARNPFLGIIQGTWAQTINSIDHKVRSAITDMEELPTMTKLPLNPDDVVEELKRGDPEVEDKIMEPTARTANANYVMISRWAMLVCASIDLNDEKILDQNPIRALQDYVEYRQKNPTLALPKPKAARKPKEEAEPAPANEEEEDEKHPDVTDEEREQRKREFEQEMARAEVRSPEPVANGAGEPLPETTALATSQDAELPPTMVQVMVPREFMPQAADRGELLLAEIINHGIQPSDPTTDATNEIETWVRVKGKWFGPVTDAVAYAVVTRSLEQERKAEAA